MSRDWLKIMKDAFLAVCGIAVIAFALSAGWTTGREARPKDAEAQTYVRPSKGKAITLLAATTMGGSTTSSATFDMTAFVSAQIFVTVTNLANTPISDCAYAPYLRVRGGAEPSTTSTYGALDYSINTVVSLEGMQTAETVETTRTWSYFVNNLPPYAAFFLTTSMPAGTGAASCSVAWSMVPLPYYTVDAANIAPQVPVCTAVSNGGGGGGGYYTKVFSTSNTALPHRLVVQNKGTAAVACTFGSGPTQWLSPSTTSMTLAASTTAYDGTGATWTIESVYSDISCTALTTSGTHYVCVTAY